MGGEREFLDWLRERRATAEDLPVPVGDDAAVLRIAADQDVVVAADAIAEGAHFERGEEPALIGRKALAVNLSDIAAMGATPRFAFATAALPRGFSDSLPREITRGLETLAKSSGVLLAGGDTISHEGGLVLSVTVVGFVPRGRAIRRSGAKPGDGVYLTGAIGGSLGSGRHLRFEPRLPESARLSEFGPPSSMIDVSDGLALDLSRLCAMGGVGARLDAAAIPIHPDARDLSAALGDGEDFELLFTMSDDAFERVKAAWDLPTRLSRIGSITASGLTIMSGGVESALEAKGFEHG